MAAFPRLTNPRHTRSTHVRLAGLGLAALGLVLTGCASDPEPAAVTATATPESTAPTAAAGTGTAAVIVQAGQKTIETGSARFKATGSTKTDERGSSDTPNSTKYSMEGSYDFENKAISAKMSGAIFREQGEVEIISIDGIAYMRLPSLGGKWLKAPLPASASSGSLSDPSKAFDALENLAKLKEVGPDPVDGVQATKYSGTIKDLEKALTGAGVPISEGDAAKISGKSDTSVWVDEDGRLIKMMNKTKAKVGGLGVESSTSMSLYDLGADVDIQAPPADQVSELSDLSTGITQ